MQTFLETTAKIAIFAFGVLILVTAVYAVGTSDRYVRGLEILDRLASPMLALTALAIGKDVLVATMKAFRG